MKLSNLISGLLIICALTILAVTVARADDTIKAKSETTFFAAPDEHPYSQIFTLQAGAFRPASISLSNSSFKYYYNGNSLNSYSVEPGWSLKLFHLLGAFYIQENLFLSTFKANMPASGDSLSLFMVGVDTRVKYAMEWFPLRAIVPFVEGGYQYTFYAQSGPSDFESAQGSVGNLVAAAGVDIWINSMLGQGHDVVTKYNAIPVFLTAKVNHIVSQGGDVNLGGTNVMAGLSIGI